MIYNIKHPDIYEWIKENKQHFDFSNSKRADLFDDTNEGVLGLFKCENKWLIIKEWLALNPKMYSFKYQHELENSDIKNKKALKKEFLR